MAFTVKPSRLSTVVRTRGGCSISPNPASRQPIATIQEAAHNGTYGCLNSRAYCRLWAEMGAPPV